MSNVRRQLTSRKRFESLSLNFQLSEESNQVSHWFCFILLSNWSRKLAPPYQPIRCKTKTNRGLVARVFPRFTSLLVVTLRSNRLLVISSFVLIGRCDCFVFGLMTFDEKLLYVINDWWRITNLSNWIWIWPERSSKHKNAVWIQNQGHGIANLNWIINKY